MATTHTTCSIVGCKRPVLARGWCSAHYGRWRNHGDPNRGGPLGGETRPDGCSVDGCTRSTQARGWCDVHYGRWRRHGDPLGSGKTSVQGIESRRFIETAVLPFRGDDCLIWPYGKDNYGYGKFWLDGRIQRVNRVVCERVHGPAPTPEHEAAHSCGNGHLSCCNPAHLRWATCKENCADRLIHGTIARGERHGRAKLTESAVREIRKLRGKMLQREIAEMFSTTAQNVGDIQRGSRWSWLS